MEERESLISQLTRGKQGFTTQIDELKRLIEEETKVIKQSVLGGVYLDILALFCTEGGIGDLRLSYTVNGVNRLLYLWSVPIGVPTCLKQVMTPPSVSTGEERLGSQFTVGTARLRSHPRAVRGGAGSQSRAAALSVESKRRGGSVEEQI